MFESLSSFNPRYRLSREADLHPKLSGSGSVVPHVECHQSIGSTVDRRLQHHPHIIYDIISCAISVFSQVSTREFDRLKAPRPDFQNESISETQPEETECTYPTRDEPISAPNPPPCAHSAASEGAVPTADF